MLAVVGDIACQPGEVENGTIVEPTGEAAHELCSNPKSPYTSTSLWQSQEATANLIEAMKPDAVAIAGDLQYQVGQYSDFQQSFDLTYGAFKFLHRPAPGNHEFYNEHSETGVAGYGYFSYYNGFQINANGTSSHDYGLGPVPTSSGGGMQLSGPYHSQPPTHTACGWAGGALRIGAERRLNRERSRRWLVLLQSRLLAPYLTQYRVLDTAGRLLEHRLLVCRRTRMAEKGSRGESFRLHCSPTGISPRSALPTASPQRARRSGLLATPLRVQADLVLNGHDHLYARYRPLDPSGNSDPKKGIREFIVGTGGETLDAVVTTTERTAARSTGNPKFNASNLEASTGNYWGVMALTLDPNGYQWDFESALQGPVAPAGTPATFTDHGAAPATAGPAGVATTTT